MAEVLTGALLVPKRTPRLRSDEVKALIKGGANPEAMTATLEAAARRGAMKIVETLVANGIWSAKAAELAEENGHYPLARLLREAEHRETDI